MEWLFFSGVRWWWTSHLCVAMQNYWLRAWPALWVQVIMIGTVRSNLENATGFVRDWRRINVAMTRAKSLPQEQVLPKAFNMNSLTYWTKFLPKLGWWKTCKHKIVVFFKDTNCFSGLSTCSCSRFFNHQLIDSLSTPNVKFRSVISPRSGLLVVCNPLTLARDSVSWYLGVHRWWPGC